LKLGLTGCPQNVCNYQQMLGTALQAGRLWVWFPMVSLDFFIHIFLPATLWPWGWPSL